MNLQRRIDIMCRLGKYLAEGGTAWENAKQSARAKNSWFIPSFIELSAQNITGKFLKEDALRQWAEHYAVPENSRNPQEIGIIMAGNIPMVGFHDLLAVFVAGHRQRIKLSSKDSVMISHILEWLFEQEPESKSYFETAESLKGCDAYIATGSRQSSRYFEYYFSKYPHIIRPGKTSIAILEGDESAEDLEKLADDINLYFGLGCRNVTQLLVPAAYDFDPLLKAMDKYKHLREHHAYSNNFDYRLAILLLGRKPFLQTDHLLLTEGESPFSPISMLHYRYYKDKASAVNMLESTEGIQCVVGKDFVPFGAAQSPELTDYADGVDTMEFLRSI